MTKTYKHSFFVFITILAYGMCMGVMAISSQSIFSVSYLGCLLLALLISLLLPIGAFSNCIFLTIPFTAVLKLPIEAFSFITLIQLLLIVRCILFKERIVSLSIFCIIFIICTLTQLIPVLIYNQTFSNIILLSFNVMTFYCVYSLTQSNLLKVRDAYLSFSLGVVIAGFVSMSYGVHAAEIQDYRFCGLWTDPNFWGMFCLIGIVSCLMAGFQKPLLFVILAPMILALAYYGFMSLSRTFVVICSLMVVVISCSYLKRSVWGSLLVIGILGLGIYYAFPYAIEIFTKRSIDSSDVTNGRLENALLIFDFIGERWGAMFFGFGYNNILNVIHSLSFEHGASHNSYMDLFADFGLIFDCLLFLWFIQKRLILKQSVSQLASLPGCVFCVILFYMGTLSMLKYALLFLFAGTYIGYATRKTIK